MNTKKYSKKIFALVLLLTLCVTAVRAQKIKNDNFNTTGLVNTKLFDDFFTGNFIDIPFNRDDPFFNSIITTYMYTYAKECASYLPDNKIEITEDECKTESVTRNGYGIEISRYCVEWVKVRTGLYTSPELHNAQSKVSNIIDKDAFKQMGKIILDQNRLQTMSNMLTDINALTVDVEQLFNMNKCNSLELKRFEENLILFALNKQPIKLNPDGTSSKVSSADIDYNKKQNLEKLTQDLVYENSKSWTFKYIPNSVSNIRIVSKDKKGSPSKITANYSFEGLFGQSKDEVQITFKDGLPDCIYFLNYSSTCRTPDRKVISNFLSGKYIIN